MGKEAVIRQGDGMSREGARKRNAHALTLMIRHPVFLSGPRSDRLGTSGAFWRTSWAARVLLDPKQGC